MLSITDKLDDAHKSRIDSFFDQRKAAKGKWKPHDIFLSERVVQTIEDRKLFLSHYDLQQILSLLPFSPIIYVGICKNCIAPSDFPSLKRLIETAAIVPVLFSRYASYPEPLKELFVAHDHISLHELNAFRWAALYDLAESMVCEHCADKRMQDVVETTKRLKDAKEYSELARRTLYNLYPYIDHDIEIFDGVLEAGKKRSLRDMKQLVEMSNTIFEIRSSQAFKAQQIVDADELERIPPGTTAQSDAAVEITANMQKDLAAGLGLRIPVDIPIETYIEIAKEFQPRFELILSNLNNSPMGTENKSLKEQIIQRQMAMNSEIERVKGLKRTIFLDTVVEFFAKNKTLAATSLVAGALGIAGGLAGCATGVLASGAASAAKKKGWITANSNANKLARTIKNDLQPHVDQLIAKYTGSCVSAISILNLRRNIKRVSKAR